MAPLGDLVQAGWCPGPLRRLRLCVVFGVVSGFLRAIVLEVVRPDPHTHADRGAIRLQDELADVFMMNPPGPVACHLNTIRQAVLVQSNPEGTAAVVEIEDSAFGPIRSFIGEYVVAAWRQRQGGHPVFFGGRRAGHDISDHDMLIDAKVLVATKPSERRRWPGHDWKVARDRHALFNPEKTTHVALVLLPEDMTFELADDGGRVSISTVYKDAEIFLVSVEEFNDSLDPVAAAEEGWRYLLLETAWLHQHRVQ